MQQPHFALHAEIEERHWWFVARRRIILELIERAIAPPKSALIVDVGCGTGGNTAVLARRYSCLGIDTSAEAIAFARSRYPGVTFLTGRAPADLGPELARASLVLLLDVLEHVPDDFLFFSENLARLTPGSHLLITVPADPALWSAHDVSVGHYRRYDRARLARLWTGLPVTVRLLSYCNARLYPLIRLVRALNRLRGRAAGRAGTDFRMLAAPIDGLLEKVFASEARNLVAGLDHGEASVFRHGVSLVALLRREAGPILPRVRPSDVPPDQHMP